MMINIYLLWYHSFTNPIILQAAPSSRHLQSGMMMIMFNDQALQGMQLSIKQLKDMQGHPQRVV